MTKTIIIAVTYSLILLVAGGGTNVCASDSNADMIAAIKFGDAAKVSELLSGGADPNARTKQGGLTVLMGAAYKGNADIVNLLLHKGAKVNETTDMGITALMLAAYNNHAKVVELLLGKGSDANIHEKGGGTAFQMAVAQGHVDVAEMLLTITKGASNWRIKTVVGPLEGEQKCLIVKKEPEENSQKVACLKAGREVNTSGTSRENKWIMIRKPVSGWVPTEKLKKTVVPQAKREPSARRSSGGAAAPPSRGESSDTTTQQMPSTQGGGGAWWQER